MSPASEVCVDASLAVKVVVTESDSDEADALFDQWANEDKLPIAPVFFEVEIDSILRQKVALRNELTTEQAEAAFARLRSLPIHRSQSQGRGKGRGRSPPDLVLRQCTTRPIALAELRGCEFWTADERLFNQVKDKLFFVKWLGTHVQR